MSVPANGNMLLAGEDGGYQISRSVRLRSSASARFTRTPASASNQKTWTWSGWVKRGNISSMQTIFGAYNSSTGDLVDFGLFTPGSSVPAFWCRRYNAGAGTNSWVMESTSLYRDPSAWYHVVFHLNCTSSPTFRAWINGVELTTWTQNSPPTNSNWEVNGAYPHYLGSLTTGQYFDGYLTEINFIDGQALTPTSFGAFDAITGVWNPTRYSGTYGTNGFYLNFKDPTSTTTIGYDYSGNSNNWTANNISVTTGVTYDSMVDSPTNYGIDTGVGGSVRGNYAVLNAVDAATAPSDGNLRLVSGNANYGARSTIQLPSSGKWYAECIFGTTTSANVGLQFGFATAAASLTNGPSTSGKYGIYADTTGYIFSNTTTITSGLGVISSGTVLQIAYDGATGNAWVGKANVWYNSSGGTTGDPATGANPTFTSLSSVFVYVQGINGTQYFNAGQTAFSYTAPSGFKALCTQNLTAPSISNGANYMAATTYTGTGNANGDTQTVTNTVNSISFQPDFVWTKDRTTSGSSTYDYHLLADSVRGAGNEMNSNTTAAEYAGNQISAFNSSGFSARRNTTYNQNNINGTTYVGWQWKGGGTAVTNTAGSITSSVSANTTAGFSVVTYTGNGTVGATVGHGLGVTPGMVIVKSRSATSDWPVKILPYMAGGSRLELSTTNAITTEAAGPGSLWNATNPNSTVITLGNQAMTNTNSTTYVAYCFAPISGYSAFGSYTGNGSTDGPFVYCGFRPRWVMVKRTDAGGARWAIADTSRSPYNVGSQMLYADASNTEDTGSGATYDIVSNGFKIRAVDGNWNTSGGTYIYAAFAENPFTISRAR